MAVPGGCRLVFHATGRYRREMGIEIDGNNHGPVDRTGKLGIEDDGFKLRDRVCRVLGANYALVCAGSAGLGAGLEREPGGYVLDQGPSAMAGTEIYACEAAII